MRKLQFILLFLILVLSPHVFALEYNMNNQTSATKNGTTNRYLATEIYNTGTTNTYTFGTRYSGKISSIETYFNYPFEENTTYRLTYNMNTEDFRNNLAANYWWDCTHTMNAVNQKVGTLTYISYKKVQFTFTPTENTTCIRVLIGSSNLSNTPITGISNWRLDSITLYDPDAQGGSSGGGSSGGGSTTDPNQSIINNNNENTQNIIDNNNENTQNIIDNNNENTQKIVDELHDCHTSENLLSIPDGQYANDGIQITFKDGVGTFAGVYLGATTVYIPIPETILPAGTYTLGTNSNVGRYPYILLYNNNTQIVRVANGEGKLTFTLDSDTTINKVMLYYGIDTNYTTIKPTLSSGSTLKPFEPFGEVCSSKLDNTTDAINNLNDTMKDDNIDNGLGGSFFSDFDDEDFGLSSIITIPLNTIQSLTSQSCVALNIPIPFTNSTVPLPCMTEVYQNNIPTVYNLWKIVSFGIISYFIAIDIFHMVKGFKDPESDKVEVLDL